MTDDQKKSLKNISISIGIGGLLYAGALFISEDLFMIAAYTIMPLLLVPGIFIQAKTLYSAKKVSFESYWISLFMIIMIDLSYVHIWLFSFQESSFNSKALIGLLSIILLYVNIASLRELRLIKKRPK